MSAPQDLPHAAADLARNGDAAGVAESLRQGLRVDARDEKGNTLLMLASYHGRAEVVKLLLDAGAATDLRNDKGQTPLGGVAFKGHVEIARLLLAAGADPKADQGGSTPADFAALAGRTEILALLESAQRTAGRPRSWFGRLASWLRGLGSGERR